MLEFLGGNSEGSRGGCAVVSTQPEHLLWFRLLKIPLQSVSCGFLKTESPQFFLRICKTCDLNKPVVVMRTYNPNTHTQKAAVGRP